MGSSTAYTYQGGWNNGQWANKHEYDVWGFNTKAPTYNYDPMYRATEPYYTGHPYDGSLNIYFAENRFYDTETGTWLSPDPIKDGLNWYVYCNANPVTFFDPLGLISLNYFNENFCGVDFSGEEILYINGKEITVVRKNGLLYAQNPNDQKQIIMAAYGVQDLSYMSSLYYRLKDYSVEEIANLTKTDHTISSWQETSSQWITVFNPAMKNNNTIVTRFGANVTIDFKVSFEGDVNSRFNENEKTMKELAIEGFEQWSGTYYYNAKDGVRYDSFGMDNKINVSVNVTETANGYPIMIKDVRDYTDDDIRKKGEQRSHVSYPLLYGITDCSSEMNLYSNCITFKEKDSLLSKPEIRNIEYNTESFSNVAKHEFGHVLGLGDAYGEGKRPMAKETLEVNEYCVMRNNETVFANDIEMVLYAWLTNQEQDYTGKNKSSVIRLDN